MYNRYVPQSDGSFQRNRIPDKSPPPPPVSPSPPSVQPCPPPPNMPITQDNGGVFGFLKQILPKGFDFGDLAILFLLLLMAGDNKENRNNALLTMALYFIL